jgi:L,D-peptidoglycan transpeptidase YkuD (ErfK/YbiS/YcfS/YnhG family)
VGGALACLTVGGAAVVAVGMGRPAESVSPDTAAEVLSPVTHSARVTYPPLPSATTGAPSTPRAEDLPSSARSTPRTVTAEPDTAPVPSAAATPTTRTTIRPTVPRTSAPAVRPAARTTTSRPSASPKGGTTSRPVAAARGVALPLRYGTGSATRVITVTASSRARTTATLQAWTKVTGGWKRYGAPVTAHIGSQGMTTHPSESRSATPMGSFTLTRAFGARSDPGTPLPYFKTRASDWWISQAGPLYNTHQRCSSGCRFVQGSPNEHLKYGTPYYNYAVVIDYNTRNAPGGVRAGAGSAFFLHVTDGAVTAGCVAIPQTKLVTLMKWLRPSTHPRILIGTA